METPNEISIDYYVNCKNKLQSIINNLNQNNLIQLFDIIQAELPNVQFSKNKNGYFIDIKQLPNTLITKLEERCSEFVNSSD
jgi:hypothetical protein